MKTILKISLFIFLVSYQSPAVEKPNFQIAISDSDSTVTENQPKTRISLFWGLWENRAKTPEEKKLPFKFSLIFYSGKSKLDTAEYVEKDILFGMVKWVEKKEEQTESKK